MRLRLRPSLLLAVLVLLALPAVAAADIKPIPRPDNTPAKQPAKAPVSPSRPPVTHTQTNTGSTATGSTGTATTGTTGKTAGTGTTGTTATHTPEVVVQNAEGGRDQSQVTVPLPPPPDPTPLPLVGSSEVVPSPGNGTPLWKVALLALLAAGEAFVVVRLVRRRPGALMPAAASQ